MRVVELMTENPAFCLPADTAQRAAKLMIEHDCGIVPIVDDARTMRLIGVITDRDLSNCIVASGKDSRSVRLQECMTSQVVSCREGDEVERVLDLMKENQIRRIPVCDEEGRLIGIVSQADLFQEQERLDKERVAETVGEISQPTGVPSKTRPTVELSSEEKVEEEEGLGSEEEEAAPIEGARVATRRKKTRGRARGTHKRRGRGRR